MTESSVPVPAVFLDRDGTLIEDAGYLDRLERLVVYPWSIDSVRLLNRAGFRVVVVTNQAGVARGIIDEAFVGVAHQYLQERFAAGGASIDAFYYCAHHPEAPLAQYRQRCECRKPAPGMALRAAADLHLDLERSFIIGDRWHDIAVASAIGATGILVKTGYGATEAARPPIDAHVGAIVANLAEAVSWILLRQA